MLTFLFLQKVRWVAVSDIQRQISKLVTFFLLQKQPDPFSATTFKFSPIFSKTTFHLSGTNKHTPHPFLSPFLFLLSLSFFRFLSLHLSPFLFLLSLSFFLFLSLSLSFTLFISLCLSFSIFLSLYLSSPIFSLFFLPFLSFALFYLCECLRAGSQLEPHLWFTKVLKASI